MSNAKYIATDVETDGLDPQQNSVIEMAFIALDETLLEVGRINILVPPVGSLADCLGRMSSYVHEMHTKNGLIDELYSAFNYFDPDTFPAMRVEAQNSVLTWMRSVGAVPREFVYVGCSVHFDRAMYKAQFPLLDWVASHRLIDLTAVRTVMNMAGHNFKKPAEANTHRALADAQAAVEELRVMRDTLERARLAYTEALTTAGKPTVAPPPASLLDASVFG